MPRIARSALQPPARRRSDAVPPTLRRWWRSGPAVLLQDTGAYLLPSLLPLRRSDRLLVVGNDGGAIADALASRVAFDAAPVALERDTRDGAFPIVPAADRVRGEPAQLPFGDAYFTTVVLGHQIRAWSDERLLAFLRETWRVLTHNGIVVLWEIAPSRSAGVNAVWRRLLGSDDGVVQLRTFAEVGRLGREAGFAWIQTLRLRPFLWPPGPRLAVLMRKEHYDPDTIHLAAGETPAAKGPQR